MSTNVMLRDLDISFPHNSDGRRLEVVAEGLTLFVGFSLLSTQHLSLHSTDGTHRRGADITDSVDVSRAVPRKWQGSPDRHRG